MTHKDDSKEKLIVILGPTATGKTKLSVHLAKVLGTSIVSGDSMLVYRGFDIGSAKPTAFERGGVFHALIDVLEPGEKFSVPEFQRRAAAEIHRVNAAGRIPILVGGTGLYLKALLEGYRFNDVAEDPEYRSRLEKIALSSGKEILHRMLEDADPKTAARLPVGDVRRVIRALEVRRASGQRISCEREENSLVYDACVIGLRCERSLLYARIEKRVDAMVEAGLLDEVRGLLASGVPRGAQAMQGIGYKEMAAYIAGETTFDEALRNIKKATRHFAKRQFTWYRKMPYIRWFDVDKTAFSDLTEAVLHETENFRSTCLTC